jgi:hypothetical protein
LKTLDFRIRGNDKLLGSDIVSGSAPLLGHTLHQEGFMETGKAPIQSDKGFPQ